MTKLQPCFTVWGVAEVCHEANRALCLIQGDESQMPWNDAPVWQRQSARDGVRFHLANPDASPAASHNEWMRVKLADGWVYGETKDADAKTHPCIVAFADLPPAQQAKDHLFRAIVHAMEPFTSETLGAA